MEYLYLLVCNDSSEWEDIEIYDNKEDAINASIKYFKSRRVEIFKKVENKFTPTYSFYQNGILIENAFNLL
jgi:hypothetical protein